MERYIKKAKTLVEALPYIQKYTGKVIVVKYGGNISKKQLNSIIRDVVLLKQVGLKPVLIHGAGPEISKEMEKKGIKPEFKNGLRVTDKKTMKIVEKVFKRVNKKIVALVMKKGGRAKGIMGSNGLIYAKRKKPELGLVGEVSKVNPAPIKKMFQGKHIPVVSPIGADRNGNLYNINGDTAAAAVAVALEAEKLTEMTNVEGVMENKKLIPTLTIKETKKKIKSGVIKGGMIPKVEACIYAVNGGVKKAHLINGEVEHALLLEIFTKKGIGTEIVK